MSAQIKLQEKGGRQCCAYGLGGDTAHPTLHCGFEYFQQSAKERKVVRLSSFPTVATEHCCERWRYLGQPQTAETIMSKANLSSDKLIDVFKVKTANKGDPLYEAPMYAYENLVVRYKRMGAVLVKFTNFAEY